VSDSAISHLSIELRVKLNAVESELGVLMSRISRGEADAEVLVLAHLRRLLHRLERRRSARMDAEAEVRQWQREMEGGAFIAAGGDLRSRGTAQELKDWGALARRRSFAAMEVALAAIDEATCAALQAWLAEKEVAGTGAIKPNDEGPKS
jgi:hypothetical protein